MKSKKLSVERESTLPISRLPLPPIYSASTLYFKSHKQFFDEQDSRLGYGREGSPTHFHLKEALKEKETSEGVLLCSSGLSAITTTVDALIYSNARVLVAQGVYDSTSAYFEYIKSKFNIALLIFNPLDLDFLSQRLSEGYDLLFVEPFSFMQYSAVNIRKIAEMCKKHSVISIIDATWCSTITANPLQLGFDAVVHSCTKFISGTSDTFLGAIAANEPVLSLLEKHAELSGDFVSAHDVYGTLRGIKTLNIRYYTQSKSAEVVAKRLNDSAVISSIEGANVFYPTFSSSYCNDYGYKNTDLGGSLIFIELPWMSKYNLELFFQELNLIKCGYSWGGTETLVLYKLESERSEHSNNQKKQSLVIRLHVGLEEPKEIFNEIECAINSLIKD
ncbi:PLP-dependent transferase [Vibrio sp. Of7-15]|uniref:PLP-dependent transferase n=1 Tax=Vibrio sp. Of7-15 TaxID=2724879 RepID=UPI001EF20F52|nr:PLP-dependent transferase [Vibrio sp. Of7-15]MCG7500143.1 PLP-dependent transferase [Vibrio sp. Of7-15]